MRKTRTDASVRPLAEGNVSALHQRRFLLGQESLRLEGVGVCPPLTVSLQRPRRDHHQRPFTQTPTTNSSLAQRHPRHEGNRRIQPQCLFEKRLGQRQLSGVLKAHRCIADDSGDFLPQPGEPVWLISQNIKRPGQRTCRGLVTSEEKYAQLIDELLPRKRRSGLLVARGNDATSDVIKCIGVVEMRIDQRPQMSSDPLAGGKHLRRLGNVTPGGLENQTQHVDLYRGALKQREVLKDVHGNAALQRRREHGATDNIRGEVAHGEIKRKSLSRSRLVLQGQQVIIYRRLHCSKGMAYPHVRKRGVNHRALPFPALAIGHKNAVADQVLQRTDHQVTFGKDAFGITHDFAHSVRLIKKHRRAPGIAKVADVKVISGGGQEFEQVAVTLPQDSRKRDHRPQRQWLGWDIKLRCAHLTVPTRLMQYGGVT